jgi:hypothetical protein
MAQFLDQKYVKHSKKPHDPERFPIWRWQSLIDSAEKRDKSISMTKTRHDGINQMLTCQCSQTALDGDPVSIMKASAKSRARIYREAA